MRDSLFVDSLTRYTIEDVLESLKKIAVILPGVINSAGGEKARLSFKALPLPEKSGLGRPEDYNPR